MAARGPKRQLALDANLLFDLADQKDSAHEFREVFQQKGYGLVVPPTAAHELHLIFMQGDSEEDRELARVALTNLMRWSIQPFDLDSTFEAIAEQFARSLVLRQLIPEGELNDGLILAETSLVEVPLLVTSDKHLLHIDEASLLVALNEAGLSPVHPVHPRRLLRALR